MSDIIETITQIKSEDIQQQIHDQRKTWALSNGYQVIAGEIVPKNALTGEDDLTATRTVRWDIPIITPDATYKIDDFPSATIAGSLKQDYVRIKQPDEWTIGYPEDDFNSKFDSTEFEV